MTETRMLDAMCSTCQDVRKHRLEEADPGSCVCTVCGAVQQMFVPVA